MDYESKDDLVGHLLTRQAEANIELLCAWPESVSAPEYVIREAEGVMAVWSSNRELEQEEFSTVLQATTNARMAFLDAARHDLDYEPKVWHVLAPRQ
ncbi:hypothetical protein ACNPQM_43805 [Streptomyces sp. NPDC056231]|uniref:hypothetical protein n=1 Tax=Streptomyces sp. NPDC056231 TaxID=3345755 RepID=UPI003AAFC1E3